MASGLLIAWDADLPQRARGMMAAKLRKAPATAPRTMRMDDGSV